MFDTLTLTNGLDIFELYNLKVKIFPNGLVKLKKTSFDFVKGRIYDNFHNGSSTEEQLERYLKKRVKERKEKIIDLALCNSWDYFLTLTFDTKNKKYFPNGYSHEVAISLLVNWLDLQRHYNKNMKYLIVSEFTKNGILHFHGLFSNISNWQLEIAINPHTNKPVIENGCQVFNLINYNLGFSTISKIKDTKKVSIYLSKYITKELISLRNRKVFWYSRNLNKPILHYKYINEDLIDILNNEDLIFYKSFNKNFSSIEIAEIKNNT